MTITHRAPVISDVAAEAGVSVPTVSRVLNGKVRVSEEKRLRVLHAVEKLGYKPSMTAQALAAGQSRDIGILLLNTRRYGYVETLQGIEIAARKAHYQPRIHVIQPADGESVEDVVRSIMSLKVAGLVVIGFDQYAEEALKFIPQWVPTVIAGNGGQDFPHDRAVINEEPAAYALVSKLLDDGHENVVHVTLPPTGAEDPRTSGWRRALLERGITPPKPLEAEWGAESGLEIGQWLAPDPRVTAIFSGNDEVAIGLMRALREAGRRVPEDVSVVGFDDHPLSAYMNPPLTTANLDFQRMGAEACELLIKRLESETEPHDSRGDSRDEEKSESHDSTPTVVSIDAQIVVRESTAAPTPLV